MTTKTLYIVEGPSGSGKSTFLKTLEGMGKLSIARTPVEIPRPRAYEHEDNGVSLSSFKDMAHLWAALMNPATFVAMDRGFISQLVYGAIRKNEIRIKGVDRLRYHISSFIYFLSEDLRLRGSDLVVPSVEFVFFLPPAHVIEDRRRHSSIHDYVYPVEKELELYRQALSYLSGAIVIHDPKEEKIFTESLDDTL